MTDKDLITRAKGLIHKEKETYVSSRKPTSLGEAKKLIDSAKSGLDVYINFDTTGSMHSYISAVRDNLETVTDALLNEDSIRLSINGIGDHCDGEDWIQMYALTNSPEETRGAIESIRGTYGGDEPEAYECWALALAKRIPKESVGRKRAVVLVADSVPHGMIDSECSHAGSYQQAFEALKTLSDGFYFVGCNPQMYSLQKQLIDPDRKDKEQFISLDDMVDVLPELLVALAKKTESETVLRKYLEKLGLEKPEGARKVHGLLTAGR
ncbi:vWA domain-containing protein [Nanoarchaeota archaeon]